MRTTSMCNLASRRIDSDPSGFPPSPSLQLCHTDDLGEVGPFVEGSEDERGGQLSWCLGCPAVAMVTKGPSSTVACLTRVKATLKTCLSSAYGFWSSLSIAGMTLSFVSVLQTSYRVAYIFMTLMALFGGWFFVSVSFKFSGFLFADRVSFLFRIAFPILR